MKSKMCSIAMLFGVFVAVAGFGSSDDRFLKKYAMMKIYESCFGAEVVKEIRQEMKAACAKCAQDSIEIPQMPQNNMAQNIPQNMPQNVMQGMPQNMPPNMQQAFIARIPPSMGYIANNQVYGRPDAAIQDPNQNNEISLGQIMAAAGPQIIPEQPNIDTEKLQQAILAYRPQQQQIQGYPQQNMGPFRAAYNAPVYQPIQATPYFQPWGPQQYFPQQYFPQPYQYLGNRMSRDMDIRSKLELLTARTSGRVRNVTCVMQELGYLDQNLEPNFEKIAARIANLPVSAELKADMQEGLQFCQKFAQCVPETKKENSPLSRELIKPMFFFKCYKHKKLEACVMKDVRERFTSEEDLDTDTDFRSMSRVGRAMKNGGTTGRPFADELDDMAASMYEFLYGSSEMELESLL